MTPKKCDDVTQLPSALRRVVELLDGETESGLVEAIEEIASILPTVSLDLRAGLTEIGAGLKALAASIEASNREGGFSE